MARRRRGPGLGQGARGQRLQQSAAGYTSPNIGGVQPEGVQFGAFDSGSILDQIKRNEWLQTLSPEDKLRAQNQMGYWTGGQPVQTPRAQAPSRQYLRQLDLDPGQQFEYQSSPGVYAGIVSDQGGRNTYDPLRALRGGRPGLRPPGGDVIQPPGGRDGSGVGYKNPGGFPIRTDPVPHAGIRGRGGDQDRPRRRQDGPRGPQGGQGGTGYPPPPFLPSTPGYEAAVRGFGDEYSQAQTELGIASDRVKPFFDLASRRIDTNEAYDIDRLLTDLAGRGMIGAGVQDFLTQRDIGVPYGRERQDLLFGAAGEYGDLAGQLGGAGLAYNRGQLEALLDRAAAVSEALPYGLPQYGDIQQRGGGQRRSNRDRGRNRPRRRRR